MADGGAHGGKIIGVLPDRDPEKGRESMLLISSHRLRELVQVDDAVKAVREAFIDASAGVIEQPPRLALDNGDALAMMARDRRLGGTVLKVTTVRPTNPDVGLSAVQAVVLWFDGPTGAPLALIDGTTLTSMRTGAASAVATDLLAAPDADLLAVIGAGGQAADQIRSVCAVRPIREARITDRVPQRAFDLARRLGPELPTVRLVAVGTASEAVAGATVICTVTNSSLPLFSIDELSETVHINAIGAFTPAMCELPPELLADASVLAVDHVESALREAGDIIQALGAGYITEGRLAELGELLTLRVPRSSRGRTVFKSVGIAAQDLALAQIAVARENAAAGSASLSANAAPVSNQGA